MAINQQAYTQYNNNKVLTASPAELTLLLYEGAIKFCNIAMIGVEQKDIEKTHNNLKKAQSIIEELRATLNYKYPVAKDFEEVYKYIYSLLVTANITKKTEDIEVALEEIRGMRDTWKQVMQKTKSV